MKNGEDTRNHEWMRRDLRIIGRDDIEKRGIWRGKEGNREKKGNKYLKCSWNTEYLVRMKRKRRLGRVERRERNVSTKTISLSDRVDSMEKKGRSWRGGKERKKRGRTWDTPQTIDSLPLLLLSLSFLSKSTTIKKWRGHYNPLWDEYLSLNIHDNLKEKEVTRLKSWRLQPSEKKCTRI